MTIKTIHDTDIGLNLEVVAGKVQASDALATDAEVLAVVQASELADASEEQAILTSIRLQEGILHNAVWELAGTKIKCHTEVGTNKQLLSLSSTGGVLPMYFPQAGESIPSLQSEPARVVDADGFVSLPAYGALWYKFAGDNQGWYWSIYSAGNFNPSAEYLRVVSLNSGNNCTALLSDGRRICQGLNFERENNTVGGKVLSVSRYVNNIGVFEGFIVEFNSMEGDFASAPVSDDSVRTDAYIHFRLPWTPTEAKMYRLHFKGHSFQAANKIIDFTVAGDSSLGSLYNPEVVGTHAPNVDQYTGSDGHVYVRVGLGDVYYLTLAIDSMGVGNGEAMQHGSIKASINPAATI